MFGRESQYEPLAKEMPHVRDFFQNGRTSEKQKFFFEIQIKTGYSDFFKNRLQGPMAHITYTRRKAEEISRRDMRVNIGLTCMVMRVNTGYWTLNVEAKTEQRTAWL